MRKSTLTLLFGSAVMLASPAHAGQSSSTMPVTATVLESCTIAAGPMTFGDISLSGSDVDSTATLTLACTPNADFDILMNNGVNASAGQRRMANIGSTEFIPYEVYLDSTRSSRWGNTVGTDTKAGAANALGQASYTAYGRIASGTSAVTGGVYTDTITVTVSF